MKVSMVWDKLSMSKGVWCGMYYILGSPYFERKYASEYKGLIGVGSTMIEAIKNCCERGKQAGCGRGVSPAWFHAGGES